MTSPLEIAGDFFNAASVLLAGLNSRQTWWTGIVGCVLFAILFYGSQLYADVLLQVFFTVTSITGWYRWLKGNAGTPLPVRHTSFALLSLMALGGILVAIAYGATLRIFTNAYAPFLDSTILVFSVIGQFLLMERRIETWWCWLLVNTIAVPVYFSRGLTLTAILYACFWVNALIALYRWRRFLVRI